MKKFESHGNGYDPWLARYAGQHISWFGIGKNVIFEKGCLVWHPENIEIGDNVYIGHQTMLKGYHKNKMLIGSDVWIGQNCYFNSAGGISIGHGVGIGPCVKILSSAHDLSKLDYEQAIMEGELKFERVWIDSGADIGMGSIILSGVKIGRYVVIGAGSVVTKDVPNNEIWAGNPAKLIRRR